MAKSIVALALLAMIMSTAHAVSVRLITEEFEELDTSNQFLSETAAATGIGHAASPVTSQYTCTRATKSTLWHTNSEFKLAPLSVGTHGFTATVNINGPAGAEAKLILSDSTPTEATAFNAAKRVEISIRSERV